MSEKAGFQIGDRFYPFPEAFRLGDMVLVSQLTGLEWDDFAGRFDASRGDGQGDSLVLVGLVGVALWQGNQRWTLAHAVHATHEIDVSTLETVGGDEDPLAEGAKAPENHSDSTSAESTTTDTLPV